MCKCQETTAAPTPLHTNADEVQEAAAAARAALVRLQGVFGTGFAPAARNLSTGEIGRVQTDLGLLARVLLPD